MCMHSSDWNTTIINRTLTDNSCEKYELLDGYIVTSAMEAIYSQWY